MSYSRFSNADVYVFPSSSHRLECCGCWLPDVKGSFQTRSIDAMAEHLEEHRQAGHNVPGWVMEGIRADEEWLVAEDIVDVSAGLGLAGREKQ